jgi:hypothetical protein
LLFAGIEKGLRYIIQLLLNGPSRCRLQEAGIVDSLGRRIRKGLPTDMQGDSIVILAANAQTNVHETCHVHDVVNMAFFVNIQDVPGTVSRPGFIPRARRGLQITNN